jgi:hypothetical protein
MARGRGGGGRSRGRGSGTEDDETTLFGMTPLMIILFIIGILILIVFHLVYKYYSQGKLDV